jgi:16S rRNA (adenine1518-N6/adenine1519-N6)-dimethyltransferase
MIILLLRFNIQQNNGNIQQYIKSTVGGCFLYVVFCKKFFFCWRHNRRLSFANNPLLYYNILQIMAMENFIYKKGLGQNFIYDHGFLRAIVRELNIIPADYIVEIGTGAGSLTKVLAETGATIKTVEIDERLQSHLTTEFANIKNVDLVFGDVMEIDWTKEPKFRIVANVPYYITTPILMQFLNLNNCTDINILVAKDVADRIVAVPNTGEYGALSVTAQVYGECKIIKTVPKTIFVPQPKIDSAFVKITKYDNVNCDKKLLEKLLKGLFALRRKTILNGLTATLNLPKTHAHIGQNVNGQDKNRQRQNDTKLQSQSGRTAAAILNECGIDPGVRPENLPPSKFVELCQNIAKYSK